MLSMWCVTSILGPILYVTEPNKWKLMLWPYVYMFFTFLVFIRFILKRDTHLFPIDTFIRKKSIFIDILNYIYIICAVYELMNIDLAVLSFSFLSEEAQELYMAAHEDNVIVKSALFYAQRYTSALFILSVITVFNYLAQGRKLFGWTLFVFILVSVVAGNAEIAARGVIMSQIIVFFSAYLLYRPFLSNRVKKTVAIGGITAGTLVGSVLVAITVSRFSDNSMVTGYDSPLESIISYFGHSMLYFNYGICDVDFETWGGSRTFNYFAMLLFGIDFRQLNVTGVHAGTSFITFIGMLVRDFGYVGTVIFGFVVSWGMYKLWSGNNAKTFAGMYIYIFYLNRMIMGVFVTAPGSDYTYAWAILTYFFLKFILKSKKGEEIKKLATSVTEKIKV